MFPAQIGGWLIRLLFRPRSRKVAAVVPTANTRLAIGTIAATSGANSDTLTSPSTL